MKTLSTSQEETIQPSPKKSKAIKILFFIIFIIIVGIAAIWHFGSQNTHSHKNHPLFSSFEESTDHNKLSAQLLKNKLSILLGKKQDGIFQFAEHLANKLSKKSRAVFVQEYNKDHFEYYQMIKEAKVHIDSLLGQPLPTGDWILLSKNGDAIPLEVIAGIQKNNPNGKLLIVTTNKLKVKGFKQFAFKPVDKGILQKSATKGLKIASKTAQILFEYLSSAEAIYLNMNDQNFNLAEFLGENNHELTGLQKADKLLLETLCVVGVATSKKEIPSLSQIGVIFDGGNIYWETAEKILNYELKTNLNCKNSVAPEEVLQRKQQASKVDAQDTDVDDDQVKPQKTGKKEIKQSSKAPKKGEKVATSSSPKEIKPSKTPKSTSSASNSQPTKVVKEEEKGKGKKQA